MILRVENPVPELRRPRLGGEAAMPSGNSSIPRGVAKIKNTTKRPKGLDKSSGHAIIQVYFVNLTMGVNGNLLEREREV